MSDLASLLEKVRSAVSRVPKNLTEHKLRQRSKSMLDAGHTDDADLDIEAANAISALERELEEARALNEQLRGETYLSSAEAAEFHRDNAVTMWDAERARATAAEAKAARIGEALKKARVWHESEEKALSKQPPSYGPNGNEWARLEHKEQMAEIDAALQSEKDREGVTSDRS